MLVVAAMLALSSPDSAHHVRLESETVIVESQWDDTAAPLGVALPSSARLDVLDTHRLRMTLPLVDATSAVPLPIPRGNGVHRVTFDRDAVFQPATSLELSPRGIHAVDHGVQGPDVERVDRVFGGPLEGSARYLRSDSVREHGGAPGSLESREQRRQRLLLLAAGVFVFIVAALAALVRAVGKRAEVERADALLTAEIEQLGP